MTLPRFISLCVAVSLAFLWLLSLDGTLTWTDWPLSFVGGTVIGLVVDRANGVKG